MKDKRKITTPVDQDGIPQSVYYSDDVYFEEQDIQADVATAVEASPTPVENKTKTERRKPKVFTKNKRAAARSSLSDVDKDLLSHENLLRELDDIASRDERSSIKAKLIKRAFKRNGFDVSMPEVLSELIRQQSKKACGNDLGLIAPEDSHEYHQQISEHIVRNLLVRRALNILTGLSNSGKTVYVFMMLAAILLGRDTFMGRRIDRSDGSPKVIYLGLDGGPEVLGRYLQKAGLTTTNSAGQIKNHPDFHILGTGAQWFIGEDCLERLEQGIKAIAPDGNCIVIVDSLAGAILPAGIDENSAGVGLSLMDFKNTVINAGGTPLVVCHQKKGSLQDDVGSHSIRGSSTIPAFADHIMSFNFTDLTSSVGKNKRSDVKSSLRRLYSDHRGVINDQLLEFDWDLFDVKDRGDFYDALYSIELSADLAPDNGPALFKKTVDSLSKTKREILHSLIMNDVGQTVDELEKTTEFSKTAIRNNITQLLEITAGEHTLIEQVSVTAGEFAKPSKTYKASAWSIKHGSSY